MNISSTYRYIYISLQVDCLLLCTSLNGFVFWLFPILIFFFLLCITPTLRTLRLTVVIIIIAVTVQQHESEGISIIPSGRLVVNFTYFCFCFYLVLI